jgi:glycosyltransferase involved in cell wall biosynthesis
MSSLSVVVCTYSWPDALDAVLRSLADQSDDRFDVVVADDGSGPETESVAGRWSAELASGLAYVRQPDEGFRAGRVRNLGALAARSDHLVFLDGDCVPRLHFVRAIRDSLQPGWFVATNRVNLSRGLTERILRERIPIHRWSLVRWFMHARSAGSLMSLTPRDRRQAGRDGQPGFAPRDNAYCCIGVATADFERVNGYDLRYTGWGDEDVDLSVRLTRIGLRCGHAGPHATPIHLWHPSREVRERSNWWLLQETQQSRRTEAVEGLRELAAEAATLAGSPAAPLDSEPLNP